MTTPSETPAIEHVRVPDGFLWGTATASYQVEGGVNGPGEPRNDWADWNAAGRVEPVGVALDFWRQPDLLLDRAEAMGNNSFRLSLEWARVEPEPGGYDDGALAGYRAILDACRSRGLEPVVTLQHFTHPAWAGELPWNAFTEEFRERWVAYVRRAATALGDRVRYWITLNELNGHPLGTNLFARFPPGHAGDVRGAMAAMDGMAAAHCLAYDVLHDVYEERGWPAPLVTTNNFSFCVYEIDWMIVDVLTFRQRGVATGELAADVAGRRRATRSFMSRMPGRGAARRPLGLVADLAGGLAAGRRPLPRTAAAVAASPRERKLDLVCFDFYDPRVEEMIRLPGRPGSEGRVWAPDVRLWEMPPNPPGFLHFLRHAGRYGLPVLVAENGLSSERRGALTHRRTDGWDRPAYLRRNIESVVEALAEGVDVVGYLHWCTADNYEWGSYVPACGIHGVDRDGPDRFTITDRDSMGDDSAAAYREIIGALSGEDVKARRAAFAEPPR